MENVLDYYFALVHLITSALHDPVLCLRSRVWKGEKRIPQVVSTQSFSIASELSEGQIGEKIEAQMILDNMSSSVQTPVG